MQIDEALRGGELRGDDGATALAIGNRHAENRADGPRRLVAARDAFDARSEVVVKAEQAEAGFEVEPWERLVLLQCDGDAAVLEVDDGLPIIGPQLQRLADASSHVGGEGGHRGRIDLDADIEDALEIVGDELLQEVLVILHAALGEDHLLLARRGLGAGGRDVERRHRADLSALGVV